MLPSPHVLNRAGCPLHYWLYGREGSPMVILTHGATADQRMFAEQVPLLAQEYRVLTWDVRGHGQSRPLGESFSVALAVEDLLAILDEVGCRQAVLAGQSMGTYIGQEFVFRHPERVLALVVVGGTCVTLNKLSFADSLALYSTPLMFSVYPYNSLRKAFAKASSIRSDVQDYLFQASGQIPKRDFINIWTGMLSCLHYEPGYRIQQPLLITHGEYDKTGNIKKIAPQWAERDRARYVVIPDASHCANQDNPEFFNRLLLEFLHEHTPIPEAPGR
ncbi:MAG TPA: alpha/beta hydrolase [Anaerolineales bacterium]